MAIISDFERKIGVHVKKNLGSSTKVNRYGDDNSKESIFIAECAGIPTSNSTTFGTIGLSKFPQKYGEKLVNVELLAAAESRFDFLANIVASLAFENMKNFTNFVYGEVIENIIHQYAPESAMKHCFLTSTFLWDKFENVEINGVKIHWLGVVPISQKEFEFWMDKGYFALEEILETSQVNVLNLFRNSVI